MVPKARHYRVVTRKKIAENHPILAIKKDDLSLFACFAFIIWCFGIIIGYALSHNK